MDGLRRAGRQGCVGRMDGVRRAGQQGCMGRMDVTRQAQPGVQLVTF